MAGILPMAANAAYNGTRTQVKNGGNSATVVQNGVSNPAQVHIVRRPGYTRIEQHSGNNSATIIQMTPAAGLR